METAITTSPEKVRCPACSAALYLHDARRSQYASCAQCGNFLDIADRNFPVILRKFQSNYWTIPTIPIGSVGRIDGRDYTLTGFLVKYDPKEDFFWREYLLCHPEQENYRVLAEADGHWTIVWKRPLGNDFYYESIGDAVHSRQGGLRFKHFVGYTPDLCWAAGEFDWNVLPESGHMRVNEYMAPPNIFVREQMGSQDDWYKGKYLPAGIVASAFKIDPKLLPRQHGESVLQGKYQVEKDKGATAMSRFTLLMMVATLISVLLCYFFMPPQQVFDSSYALRANDSGWNNFHPIVTEPFEIKRGGAVEIDFTTNVSNQWLELSATLINDKTGDAFEATKSIEYYFGYEGGESWTEGSQDETVIFSSVPAGTYHLNIQPYSEFREEHGLRVQVIESTTLSSNIWMMILVILFWPGILMFIRMNQNC